MSPETPRFAKIKNNFQIIFEIPTKNSFACPKMPRKLGVTIKFIHLVGFLVSLVGF
jgi:hypothetical protein